MTRTILAPAPLSETGNYRLPEEHRQAILAQSDSACLRADIERERLEFIRSYGDEFGGNSREQA